MHAPGHRRRRAAVLTGIVAAVALVVGVWWIDMRRDPATPATRTPRTPDVPALNLADLPVGKPLRAEILSGDSIYTVDGRRVRFRAPKGQWPTGAERVTDGWVVQALPAEGPGTAWYVASSGEQRLLASGGSWAVERGGGAVILGDDRTVRRVALPSGRETVRIPAGPYSSPIAAVPGWVALRGSDPAGRLPGTTGIWDVAGGRFLDVDPTFSFLDRLPDGRELVLTEKKGFIQPGTQATDRCVTAVRLSATTRPARGGFCLPALNDASASPDGTLVAIEYVPDAGQTYEVHVVAGVLAGRNRPLMRLRDGSQGVFLAGWDSDHTVLLVADREGVVVRCDVYSTRCERAPLPAGVPSDANTALVG